MRPAVRGLAERCSGVTTRTAIERTAPWVRLPTSQGACDESFQAPFNRGQSRLDTKPTRNEAMTAPPRPAHHNRAAGRPTQALSTRQTATPSIDPDLTRPTTGAAPDAEDEPGITLSSTHITASLAAAVTAAMVGSKLGVAGTVIGAGLASVISVVGGAIFGHSILLTRKQVKRAVLQVRGAEHQHADSPAAHLGFATDRSLATDRALAADDVTVVIPAVTRADLSRADLARADLTRMNPTRMERARTGPERVEPRRPRPTRRKLGAGLLVGAAAAGVIFAGSLAAVTLVEAVKGSPLSGGDSGGLSVLGGSTGTDSGTSIDVPAPTSTHTEVATVTQTVTSEPTDTAQATSAQTPPTTTAPTTTAPTTTAPTRATTTTATTTTAATSGAPTSARSSAAVAPPVSPAGTSVS